MPNETRGITVKIDADLHAQVKRYLEANNMTMTEFVTRAIESELHPKIQEENKVEKMRTLAFQVPESLFQQIKDYLRRNDMTQKDFVMGLIEGELERDQIMREAASRPDMTAAQEEENGETAAEEFGGLADVGDRDFDEGESENTEHGEDKSEDYDAADEEDETEEAQKEKEEPDEAEGNGEPEAEEVFDADDFFRDMDENEDEDLAQNEDKTPDFDEKEDSAEELDTSTYALAMGM